MDYQSENAQTIDRWVDEGWQWGVPISHDAFVDAQHGSWNILLTPTKPVPHEWVGDVRGKRVLGLASGGAQQMPGHGRARCAVHGARLFVTPMRA